MTAATLHNMSSLVCNITTMMCVFTRVNTDGPAVYPPCEMLPATTMAPTTAGNSTRYLRETAPEKLSDETESDNYHEEPPPPYRDDHFYCQEDTTSAPWTDPINQDKLSETVAITRDYRRGLLNALADDEFLHDNGQYEGPVGTEWALLPPGQTFMQARCSLNFGPWRYAVGQPREWIGKQAVVHLKKEDVYYHVKLLQWTQGRENSAYSSYENEYGGGFVYERDMEPLTISSDLPECPVCSDAKPDKDTLTPRDGTMEEVKIIGVTPESAEIEILAIAQESSPACNMHRGPYIDTVEPNAQGVGTESVLLRRTGQRGSLRPFRYTVYFKATTEAGYCRGQVQVCVPANGFGCQDDFYPNFDATSSDFCNTPYY